MLLMFMVIWLMEGVHIDPGMIIAISAFNAIFGIFVFLGIFVAFRELRERKLLVLSIVAVLIAVSNMIFIIMYYTISSDLMDYANLAMVELVVLLILSAPLFFKR